MSWHVAVEDEVRGPFEEGEILQGIAENLIVPGTLIRQDDGAWQRVEESIFARALPERAQAPAIVVTVGARKGPSTGSLLLQGLGGLVIAGSLLLLVSRCDESPGRAIERKVADRAAGTMQVLHEQVALDAIEQYRIVQDSGTAMDRCVQAGTVVAALLQAKAEKEYARWQKLKAADCRAAGLSE